jgi:hypothetical protein
VRRPPLIAFAALLALAAAFCGAAARPATAATLIPWFEGVDGHAFSLVQPVSDAISVLGTPDERLELAHRTLTEIGPSAPMWNDWTMNHRPDPRMGYPLENGNVLICGGKDTAFVREVDVSGTIVWEYKKDVDGPLVRPFSAEPATFGGRDCVLISDRDTYRVFAVTWDEAKDVVWQYGTTDTHGAGVNQLSDPFCATQIPPTGDRSDGNVLIADSKGANRAIEIQADDYNAAAPDLGYDAASIVWQYGVTGEAGSGPGHLNFARSPQRLPNGNTLITDSVGQRIIEVRTTDYKPGKPNNGYDTGSIVWSYENGVDGTLDDPNSARYVSSGGLAGKILVTDCAKDTQWVRIINKESKTVDQTIDRSYDRPSYVGSSERSDPRDARVGPDGSLWITDAGFGRVLQIGNEGTGTVESEVLQEPGNIAKAFTFIHVEAPAQAAKTGFEIWYSLDDRSFKQAKISDGRNVNFKAGTWAKRFRYRIVLTSGDRWATPVFEGLTIHFTRAKTGGDKPGGGGTKPGGSGNNGGSGQYAYPTPAAPGTMSGTGTSGTGTGSGTSGYGSGSGSYGAGSGSSGAGAGSSSAANSIEMPVQSTGSGSAQAVQGYQVQGEEGVSGVPLRAAEGSQVPEPERPGPVVPVLALVAAGLVVAAAFFIPWPFVASHMRSITGFDHTRPARFLPFRPLGK